MRIICTYSKFKNSAKNNLFVSNYFFILRYTIYIYLLRVTLNKVTLYFMKKFPFVLFDVVVYANFFCFFENRERE